MNKTGKNFQISQFHEVVKNLSLIFELKHFSSQTIAKTLKFIDPWNVLNFYYRNIEREVQDWTLPYSNEFNGQNARS